MDSPRHPITPAHTAGAFAVEHCDVPADMTLGEWRRPCAAERRESARSAPHGRVRRGLRRLLGA